MVQHARWHGFQEACGIGPLLLSTRLAVPWILYICIGMDEPMATLEFSPGNRARRSPQHRCSKVDHKPPNTISSFVCLRRPNTYKTREILLLPHTRRQWKRFAPCYFRQIDKTSQSIAEHVHQLLPPRKQNVRLLLNGQPSSPPHHPVPWFSPDNSPARREGPNNPSFLQLSLS